MMGNILDYVGSHTYEAIRTNCNVIDNAAATTNVAI
jgi:hypothetical protein